MHNASDEKNGDLLLEEAGRSFLENLRQLLLLLPNSIYLTHDLGSRIQSDLTRCKDSLLGLSRVKMLRTLVALSSMELPLALLVLVLNVIFIFFGRNTGWYYFVDSLGTELKVVGVQRKTHI